MTERLDDPQRADKPRESFRPLTEGEIECVRGYLKEILNEIANMGSSQGQPASIVKSVRASISPSVDVLCDMAVNSLLFSREIERLRTRSAVAPMFEAEGDYAPDYVRGPNGFRVQCYSAVKVAAELNAIFARSASERTDPFAEMMKRRNADADICYPGNHGGPDGKWLVTLTMQDANLIEEYFGDTLAETLEKATMGPADRRGVK